MTLIQPVRRSRSPFIRKCGMRQALVRLLIAIIAFASVSCRPSVESDAGPSTELVVAAAANLTDAFQEMAAQFTAETDIRIIYNFGATTQLMQQIEHGAPFDVFAAADTIHIDQLVESGKVLATSRAVYARGQLVLWIPEPERTGVENLADLQKLSVRYIAIANPEIAPYGEAAVEVLKRSDLWSSLESKIVRAENVNTAKQLAATGNADAVITAYSLLLDVPGRVIQIDPEKYTPIDQALGIDVSSSDIASAKRFTEFVLGPQGRAILTQFGYLLPALP